MFTIAAGILLSILIVGSIRALPNTRSLRV